jgi:hypothetical protein
MNKNIYYGPLVVQRNATKYVVSWLEVGRQGALNAPRGVPKRKVEIVRMVIYCLLNVAIFVFCIVSYSVI